MFKKLIALLAASIILLAGCGPSVSVDPSPSPLATDANIPSPEPSPTPVPPTTGKLLVVNAEEFLPVRKEPNLEAEEIDRVLAGQEVGLSGFDGIYANINYGGKEGYVLSGYLKTKEPDEYLSALDVVKPVENYSYDVMQKDLARLAELYPDRLALRGIGKSATGREITMAIVDEDASRLILAQASIQGREHMTTSLLMAQLEYVLKFKPDLNGVGLLIIPMSNPDSVVFSQDSEIGDKELYDKIYAIYLSDISANKTTASFSDYLRRWQANANGVDINRNFPANWDTIENSEAAPSCDSYKGDTAGGEPETKALMDVTKEYSDRLGATLSYHAFGSNLYWKYGDSAANAGSRSLADTLSASSGFTVKNSDSKGGYKDYAMELGIPSVTVEVGARKCPMPLDEFDMIWERCRADIERAAEYAAQNVIAPPPGRVVESSGQETGGDEGNS